MTERKRAKFNRRRFTEANVWSFKIKEKQYLVWDEGTDAARGLAILVSPKGTRSYRCVYYYPGSPKPYWKHLGRVGEIELEEARHQTRQARAMGRKGQEPLTVIEQSIRQKSLDFIERGIEPKAYLYRHYHADGNLLYIGITLQPLLRQKQHYASKDWRNMISRIVIEPFATHEEVCAAEDQAIALEFPRFNIIHNGHRHPMQELTRRKSSRRGASQATAGGE